MSAVILISAAFSPWSTGVVVAESRSTLFTAVLSGRVAGALASGVVSFLLHPFMIEMLTKRALHMSTFFITFLLPGEVMRSTADPESRSATNRAPVEDIASRGPTSAHGQRTRKDGARISQKPFMADRRTHSAICRFLSTRNRPRLEPRPRSCHPKSAAVPRGSFTRSSTANFSSQTRAEPVQNRPKLFPNRTKTPQNTFSHPLRNTKSPPAAIRAQISRPTHHTPHRRQPNYALPPQMKEPIASRRALPSFHYSLQPHILRPLTSASSSAPQTTRSAASPPPETPPATEPPSPAPCRRRPVDKQTDPGCWN